MKRFLSILALAIAACFISLHADVPDSTTIPCHYEDSNKNEDERLEPDHGQRIPPAPMVCTIDFIKGTITGESPLFSSIEEYRLYDSDDSLLFSSADMHEFVAHIRERGEGEYTLRLAGSSYTLTGWLCL